MAKKIKSKHGLSNTELACWFTLIVGTCGLAYPLYAMRRHAAERKTITIIDLPWKLVGLDRFIETAAVRVLALLL